MREYFTYGSVRGAAGNGSPYRVRHSANQKWRFKIPSRFGLPRSIRAILLGLCRWRYLQQAKTQALE